MSPHPGELPYSFSMINLVSLMPEWSWDGFDQVMAEAGTTRVELVPSMVLGENWDQQIEAPGGAVQQALQQLLRRYSVGSIQSLTYGLPINLADHLVGRPDLLKRLQALGELAKATECTVLILGSPGQKKRLDPAMDETEHKQRFRANCSWMAGTLGPELTLSLEHNTSTQGAEFCNSLADIADLVKSLRDDGIMNVGVNLDTKCLIHEFGGDVRLSELVNKLEIAGLITSVQVSLDFLARNVPHRAEDQHMLIDFARRHQLPLSLEEFGLLESQLPQFVAAWNADPAI